MYKGWAQISAISPRQSITGSFGSSWHVVDGDRILYPCSMRFTLAILHYASVLVYEQYTCVSHIRRRRIRGRLSPSPSYKGEVDTSAQFLLSGQSPGSPRAKGDIRAPLHNRTLLHLSPGRNLSASFLPLCVVASTLRSPPSSSTRARRVCTPSIFLAVL